MAARPLVLALALSLLPAAPGPARADGEGTWVVTRHSTMFSGAAAVFPDGTAFVWLRSPSVGRMARSSDFGATWSDLPEPPVTWTPVFGTPKRGFQVAAYSCRGDRCSRDVYRTEDGASRWHRAAPLPAQPRGYRQFAASQYAVARDGRTVVVPVRRERLDDDCSGGARWATRVDVMVSPDGARTWRHSSLPGPASVLDVTVFDARHMAVAMHEIRPADPRGCTGGAHTSRPAVWASSDGGRTWRRTAIRCHRQCDSVAMPAPKRIVVGGQGAMYVSDDGGRTAREVRFAPRTGDPDADSLPFVLDVAFGDPWTGWALTFGGGIWRTTDGGASWTPEPSPADAPVIGWHQIAAADAEHAVAVWPGAVLTRVPAPG